MSTQQRTNFLNSFNGTDVSVFVCIKNFTQDPDEILTALIF